MIQTIEGKLVGKGLKFTLITSRFNNLITSKLEEGAIDCLVRHDVDQEDIRILRVPGSFEIPVAARWAIDGNPDGIICLGAVVRGSTPHFDYISSGVSNGIASVSLESGIPIGFGVLTCDTLEQALERAGSKAGNKGWQCAIGTLEMAMLKRSLMRTGPSDK